MDKTNQTKITQSSSSLANSQPIDSSDPDLKGMIDRVKDYPDKVKVIKADTTGMMIMLRLLYRHCDPQDIASFIKGADSYFYFGVNSLEDCFGENTDDADAARRVASRHLIIMKEIFFGEGSYLQGDSATALYEICSFGYTESKEKTQKKLAYLMGDVLADKKSK